MTDAQIRLANRERQRKYREAHREEINQQRKDRYNARISSGKCPRCGGKVTKGYTLCSECCDYQADLNRKYAKQRKTTTKTAKKPTAKKVAQKKPSAKKAPAKKTVVKKTAVKKPTAKKTAVKKPAAKKAPSKPRTAAKKPVKKAKK